LRLGGRSNSLNNIVGLAGTMFEIALLHHPCLASSRYLYIYNSPFITIYQKLNNPTQRSNPLLQTDSNNNNNNNSNNNNSNNNSNSSNTNNSSNSSNKSNSNNNNNNIINNSNINVSEEYENEDNLKINMNDDGDIDRHDTETMCYQVTEKKVTPSPTLLYLVHEITKNPKLDYNSAVRIQLITHFIGKTKSDDIDLQLNLSPFILSNPSYVPFIIKTISIGLPVDLQAASRRAIPLKLEFYGSNTFNPSSLSIYDPPLYETRLLSRSAYYSDIVNGDGGEDDLWRISEFEFKIVSDSKLPNVIVHNGMNIVINKPSMSYDPSTASIELLIDHPLPSLYSSNFTLSTPPLSFTITIQYQN
jgi:hypothetical protein